jgi:hypothetical protein
MGKDKQEQYLSFTVEILGKQRIVVDHDTLILTVSNDMQMVKKRKIMPFQVLDV